MRLDVARLLVPSDSQMLKENLLGWISVRTRSKVGAGHSSPPKLQSTNRSPIQLRTRMDL